MYSALMAPFLCALNPCHLIDCAIDVENVQTASTNDYLHEVVPRMKMVQGAAAFFWQA